MIPIPPWLLPQIKPSKQAMRRLAHTRRYVDDMGDAIHGRYRFDVGRFLDRSKYRPHQGKKEMERRRIGGFHRRREGDD